MPIAIGFLVATFFGARSYANAVLLITAANLSGSLPTLAITPSVIRCEDNREAAWLATRGVIIGLLLILAITTIVVHSIGMPESWIFLSSYTSAVFVNGVSQAVQNQQVRNFSALCHAGIISAASVLAALCSLSFLRDLNVFLDTLGITMLLVTIASFLDARLHHGVAAGETTIKPVGAGQVWNALYSGLFGLMLLAGLFFSNLRAKNSGDIEGVVAFALGLQVFSVVVFVPGALSSYFIPALVRAGRGSAEGMLAAAQRTYLALGLPMCVIALLASPLLFRYLHIALSLHNLLTYGLIQAAAALAALNAAYNQLWVSMGRFALMAGLSALWLLSLFGCQAIFGRDTVLISLSLLIAYGILIIAAWQAARRAIHEIILVDTQK